LFKGNAGVQLIKKSPEELVARVGEQDGKALFTEIN